MDQSKFPHYQACRRTQFCKDEFPHAVALFRKVVTLPFKPVRAAAFLSADTKYRCLVNGSIVSEGPAEVGGDFGNTESPNWWFYDSVELGGQLKKGENVIAAEVVLGPDVQADYSMGQGGFLFELEIDGPTGEKIAIVSDETWKSTRSEAAESSWYYDARKEPRYWTQSRFDDSSWAGSQKLGSVGECQWKLLPREIPPLLAVQVRAVEVVLPIKESKARMKGAKNLARSGKGVATIARGCPMIFWLRFEREVTGYFHLDVDGPASTRIEVQFQESFGARGPAETYVLPGRRWKHTSRRLQGFEFAQVTIDFPGGSSCDRDVTIYAAEAIFTSFPVAYQGSFECSDKSLNRIWEVCRWTNQICMQSYHMDSPIHQEGLGCTGDYMIESLISYVCFGEARLARKDIMRTAYLLKQKNARMFHTSYSLLWVWMIHDYWKYTGDLDTVREVLPVVHQLLDLFNSYVGDSGLVTESPNYMFIDWINVDKFNMHHPPAEMGQACMSAFYYKALCRGSELSTVCSNGAAAKTYDSRAKALKESFVSLWDEKRGLFKDGLSNVTKVAPDEWLPADTGKTYFSAQTNALAVATGIVPEGLERQILERVMKAKEKTLPMVQPYFMHFVLEALSVAGLFEKYGLKEMRKWQKLLDEHPTSLKESWTFGDYSHAWGGTPAYQLPARVLGVTPAEAGCKSVLIRPQLGDLKWARGTVPTPRGPVEVSWKKIGGHLKGTVKGPAGIDVRLLVCGAASKKIRMTSSSGDVAVKTSESADGVELSWRMDECVYRIDA